MINGATSRRNILGALSVAGFSRTARSAPTINLALVLAIDCSFRVDQDEYHSQMRSYDEAFLHSPLVDLIAASDNWKIALAAFQWLDIGTEQIILPWSILATKADASEITYALAA
jgi:Protein of unknown function (DUF1194)